MKREVIPKLRNIRTEDERFFDSSVLYWRRAVWFEKCKCLDSCFTLSTNPYMREVITGAAGRASSSVSRVRRAVQRGWGSTLLAKPELLGYIAHHRILIGMCESHGWAGSVRSREKDEDVLG